MSDICSLPNSHEVIYERETTAAVYVSLFIYPRKGIMGIVWTDGGGGGLEDRNIDMSKMPKRGYKVPGYEGGIIPIRNIDVGRLHISDTYIAFLPTSMLRMGIIPPSYPGTL